MALCEHCYRQYFRTHATRCVQCATQLDAAHASGAEYGKTCGACLHQAPAFDATIVAVDYAPPVDQLVLALKFGGRLALAPLFGHSLRDALLAGQATHALPSAKLASLPTLLTCVPLGPERLAQRGFNQSLEIARPLAQALGVPLVPAFLMRLRETHAQAMLHTTERKKNIRHAFTVANSQIGRVKGQHIGVVDDVMTTGETLNEIALTLKRFGALRVTNLVFARTPAHHNYATLPVS